MAKKQHADGFHCDWDEPGAEPPGRKSTRSRVLRFHDFRWQGVSPQRYKGDGGGWRDVVRHELAGRHGEQTAFHLRYFELGAGGYSSFERHRHEHVVVVIRGQGQVRLGDEVHDLGTLDAVYVAPETPHQFLNPYEEPFGFLCIVDAERDLPQEVSEADRIREGE